jgi:hypothetical protein
LRGSDLRGSDLSGSNLSGSNLRGSDLRGSDLSGSNLSGSNLRGSDLRGSDLSGSNLSGSDLRGSNLSGAKNAALAIAQTRILPAGTITGWKKVYCCESGKGIVAQLEIPAHAKRSHAFGRKCRASEAIVVSIEGATKARSDYDYGFTYEVGQVVKPTREFDDNWQNECSTGIHFFITREEAEAY